MDVCSHGSVVLLQSDDENDSFRAVTLVVSALVYQLSKKSNPVFRMLLLVLYWAKVELVGEPSSPFSLSTLVGWLEGLDMGLEENTSFRVLLTDGRVL